MPIKAYRPDKLERLKNREFAALYLKTSLNHALKDGHYEAFLLALRDVIDAHGNIQKIAAGADISRQHLHRLMNGEGNPTLQTIGGILKELNLSLDIVPDKSERR